MSGIKRELERLKKEEDGSGPSKAELNRDLRKFLHGSPEAELIGKQLKAWRMAAKLSQEQAAVSVGIKLVKLQRVERAEAKLDLLQMRALAELYGRDWRDLMSEEEKKPDLRHVRPIIFFVHPGLDTQKKLAAELREMIRAIEDFNAKFMKK